MNKPFFLSAALVLTAGGIIYLQQTAELESLRRSISPVSASAAPVPQVRTWTPPPQPRAAPAGLLIDRLGAQLIQSLQPEQLAEFIEEADARRLSLALAAGLTGTEHAAFEKKYADIRHRKALVLQDQKLSAAERTAACAALTSESEAWTAAQLGPERTDKMNAAGQAATQADAERAATSVVSKVSQAADLSLEQKDKLYASLLERALHPAPPDSRPDPALSFRVYAEMQEAPNQPSLTEELKTILTPDQLALYEQQGSTLPARQTKTMTTAMQSMLPAAIATVQELISEPAQK